MDDDAEQNNANQNEDNKSKKSGGPEMNPHRSLAAAMKKWRENLSIVGDDENEEDENAKNTGGGENDDINENDAAAEFEFMHGGEENEEKGPAALAPATEEQAVTQKLKGANTGEEGEEEQLNDDEKEINAEEFFKNKDEKNKKIDQADLDARNKEDPMKKEEEDVAGEMAEKQQQKKGNKKKNHRDKNFAPDDELQREDNVDANGGEVKDDDQNDDSENMASDDETDEAALLRKKKELEEKRLLEEAIVELKNANIEHDDDEEERATTTRELTEEEIEIARAEAEKDLQMFREDKDNAISEMDEDAAQHLWRTLEDLTGALSGELSEQLRLILEPTLASRLRGDYRTGKRLNMRKIIPYIASDFRKDKIWLRRSKPSERRYQVVLAVDDSLSMSENKRDRAALEAMVLLARAMSRLEVGDIGVVGFGGCVKTLHPLGEPFADQNGPKLVSKLTFRQDSTLADRPMVTLLESLHQQLSLARENSSSRGSADAGSNLQQLVLIIADGQFHEKEALSKVMREFGNQKGVLIAFIVLDNPDKSLLDMQSVSFDKGKPKMTKYLDSFPFPYYVVVQESNQLPSTISDLLRQWIEMVSNNSD
jgi:midasin